MNYVHIKLEHHVLYNDAERGAWCERCLKPSLIKVPSIIVNASTLGVIDRSMLCVCNDCGRHHYEPTVTDGATCDDA